MSAPQDKSTEKLRAPEKEVRVTKEVENLNENAEEETELEKMVFADLQQFIKDEILKIKDKLKAEDEKKSMVEIPLSEAQKFTVEVTFNEKDQEMCNDLSKGHDYFTKTKKSILGGPSFSRDRIYFEVDVKKDQFWGVGVAEDYGERTGKIQVNPENGFWMISKRLNKKIKAYEDGYKHPCGKPELDKVGVFVDFGKGLVTFYNVNTSAIIYTFRAKGFPKLRPVIL